MNAKVAIRIVSVLCLSFLSTAGLAQSAALSPSNPTYVANRTVVPVDETKLVRLQGNVHPMARTEFDRGPVAAALPLERMVLVLRRSPEQEAALTGFMAEQYDPNSPNFHHWLKAEQFGRLYGPSDGDLQAVTGWLEKHGFRIDNVSKGRVTIEFSGWAGQVQEAFHTEIHNYMVHGEEHIANVSDPQIPQALAPVVLGVASLHNFFAKPQMVKGELVRRDSKTGKVTPLNPPAQGVHSQFTYTSTSDQTKEDITPLDFATIYNVLPLWNAGTTGKGVGIAISGVSDITLSDVATFQATFGLPNNVPKIIHNGTDPGLVQGGRDENTLDVEWSGAVAPLAQIILVVSGNTATTQGPQLSASYIVDNEVAPVMSASYGQCELDVGTAGNAAFNGIYQQGAAEGISIFESAGDQGSAGCDNSDATTPNPAQGGLQVNGLASSPYLTAVGGTDFAWQGQISTYWNSTNNSDGANAKGYIPETPWNPTCTNPLIVAASIDPNAEAFCNDAYEGINYTGLQGFVATVGGSGGVSACTKPTGSTPASCAGGYAKPAWQTGTGVPADSRRDLPDVSLFASGGLPAPLNGSAYLVCDSAQAACDYADPGEIIYQEIGGTSASSPAMAGIMALVVQKMGAWQGLANPVFYALAAKETVSSCNSNTVAAGNSCVFYDTTSGTNSVTCVTGSPNCVTNVSGDPLGVLSGYNTGTGYDRATGLGSVNATNLVNAWSAAAAAQDVLVSPASLTFTSPAVGTASAAQTITVKNTGSGARTITIADLEFGGTNYTSYSGTTTCGATLAAGSTCTVSVTFKPTKTGTLTAYLLVFDNATGSPQYATLSGSISAVTPPVASLSPTSLTFASTVEGSTTAAQAVTLKNTGGSTLTITSGGITISGTNTSSFTKTATTCGSTVAAGSSCTISIAFKPAATGTLTASLKVADNASGSPQAVSLTGTGTAATKPTVSLTPTSLTFPNTVSGSSSLAQTVTLKNVGTTTVTVSSIAIAGTNPTSFNQLNTCGTTLASGASCLIFAVFKPTAAAALTAKITVTDTATGSPQSVTLSGTGTAAPKVTLSPTSLTFASTAIGKVSVAKPVTVKNAGTAALNFTTVALTGTNASSFRLASECGGSMAAGASCTILVALDPATAGTLKANLSIADNGSGSPQLVTLTGTAP